MEPFLKKVPRKEIQKLTPIALEQCAAFHHVSDLAPSDGADSDLLVGLKPFHVQTELP